MENKVMTHVIQAAGQIRARVERIIDQLGIVGTGHDRSGIGSVIDSVTPGIGSAEGKALRESLISGHDQAVVCGMGCVFELEDAAETGNGSRLRELEIVELSARGTRQRNGSRAWRAEIDVTSPGQMRAAHSEIADREGNAIRELMLELEVVLLNHWLLVVGFEYVNGWRAGGAARRRCATGRCDRGAAQVVGISRHSCRGKSQRLDVDAVVGVRGANQNGRSIAVKDAPPAANNGLIIVERAIGEAKARSDVVGVGMDAAGIEAGSQRPWIGHAGLLVGLDVIAQAQIKGQA